MTNIMRTRAAPCQLHRNPTSCDLLRVHVVSALEIKAEQRKMADLSSRSVSKLLSCSTGASRLWRTHQGKDTFIINVIKAGTQTFFKRSQIVSI